MFDLILGVISMAAIGALVWLVRRHLAARSRLARLDQEYAEFRRRYAPILDVEASEAQTRKSIAAARVDLEREKKEAHALLADETKQVREGLDLLREHAAQANAAAVARQEELARAYQEARAVFVRLQREVALLEENLEDISFGVYRPHYEYATSEEYRNRLEQVWRDQKALIQAGRHVTFGVEWTIGNSRKEGERMQKQYGKLLLRAFNGECDASIAKVSWNNVMRMEERIRKGFEAINDLGGVMKISITPEYRDLRFDELRLHFELEEKRRAEAEEQRRLREQMREDERADRELARAREEAEEEERRYAKALERAREEAARAKGAELGELNEKVARLQQELEEARKAKEHAISQAQLTRSGHVYIISNVGSFGEKVVKIGMTRRLEPRDRVRELGDASVPFEFDIHGLIYSEDAPALETELHQRFHDRRVNLVNERKEFFRVAVSEVDQYLRTQEKKVELTLLAEAREYRQTLAMREEAKRATATVPSAPASSAAPFPADLFPSGSPR